MHLLVAADQRGDGPMQRLEPTYVRFPASTRQAGYGSGRPFSAMVPSSWQSNRPPICRRVAASITTWFGPAEALQACREVWRLTDRSLLTQNHLSRSARL